MKFFKLLIISFCCIASIRYVTDCAEIAKDTQLKDTSTALESKIHRIKRLNRNTNDNHKKLKLIAKDHIEYQKPTPQHQQQQQEEHHGQQQQQHQQLEHHHIAQKLHEMLKKPQRTKKLKYVAKTSHSLNKKLLNKLGFSKVKAPNSHNRKRLAIESRRHASPDDSHMFIIKLPPNPHYYTNPNANNIIITNSDNTMKTMNSPKNMLLQATDSEKALQGVAASNGKKVSVHANLNGKPGRIYHWNLPVLQKLLEDKERFVNLPNTTKQHLIDIKHTPTWTKPWENETVEKSYGKAVGMSIMTTKDNYKKSMKRKSPSYYAPANTVNKSSFNKYFAGNGKPKGFYVIKENQKKPLFYKNIVS